MVHQQKGKKQSIQGVKSFPILQFLGWVFLGGIIAYGNSFSGVFLYDGVECIVNSESVRSLDATWNATHDQIPSGLFGRPVARWTFAVNYAFGGLNPWGYHLWNLIVHLIAAALLFGIVRRTLLLRGIDGRLQKASAGLALSAALLWVVHPLQTESVTYIVQRLESMMGMFFLACLYCVLRGSQSKRSWPWYSAAVVSCWLGMGTKEVMITCPLVVLLYDRIYLQCSWREVFRLRWRMYIGFSLAALWLIYATIENSVYSAKAYSPRQPTLFVPDSWGYFCSQPKVLLHYLRLCFWPQDQCLDHMWPTSTSPAEICIPGIVIVGLLALCLVALRYWPRWGFNGICFFIILAPTSTIIPLHLVYEHRMYLPLANIMVLTVIATYALISWLRERGHLTPSAQLRISKYLLLIAALFLATLTFLRNTVYQSPAAMWGNVVQVAPHSPRGHIYLAKALQENGQQTEALIHFEECIRLIVSHPNSVTPSRRAACHNDYGTCLLDLGQIDGAIAQWREAIHFHAGLTVAHKNLAIAYNQLGIVSGEKGDQESAIRFLKTAVEYDPELAEAYSNLGIALIERSLVDEGMEQCSRAIQLNPNLSQPHYVLGLSLLQQGKTQDGIRHLEEALRINPQDATTRRALVDWYFRQGGDRSAQQDWEGARRNYARTISLMPRFPEAHCELGRALLELDSLDLAEKHLREALRLNPELREAKTYLQSLPKSSG